jgi:hypothetical protein
MKNSSSDEKADAQPSSGHEMGPDPRSHDPEAYQTRKFKLRFEP